MFQSISLRTFSLLCLAGMILSACATQSGPAADVGAKVQFKINVDTWIGYAPLYLAKEKGFYDGINVEIITTPDVAQRKLILERGENQAIAETVDQLVLDHDQGIHSVAILGMDFSNGADGIVATDAIKTLEDLKGKTVLVQKNYASEALLDYLLEKNGIAFSDVNKVDTEAGAAGAAFAAGKAEAAVTFEPWLSKAKERAGGHILLSSKDAPGVIVDILSVQEQYLKDHPETVAKVARGWFRAVDYWNQHPEESNAIMAKHYQLTPQEFAEQVTGLRWPAYKENVAYFTKGATPSIYDVTETFVDIFRKTGQISGAKPDLSSAVDASILAAINGTR
ncbi:ABC transporter substrate-binding protein [Candidatus Uhrbacteria bacterium]|nr:ABC transporter substrate-binding protein [Candidatus Uhrbacteria bacterium]